MEADKKALAATGEAEEDTEAVPARQKTNRGRHRGRAMYYGSLSILCEHVCVCVCFINIQVEGFCRGSEAEEEQEAEVDTEESDGGRCTGRQDGFCSNG